MNEDINPSKDSRIDINSLIRQSIVVKKVHDNLSQEVILTTEDKVNLCLLKYLKQMEKKRGWMAPAGVLITIIITLVTSDFKDVGLEASVWSALFIIAGILSFIWLVFSIFDALKSKSIEDVVTELKKGSRKIKDDLSTSMDEVSEETKGFRIIKAAYSTPANSIDVTKKLNALIKDGKLNTTASNDMAGKDPEVGKIKTLEVEYEHNDKIFTKTYTENDAVNLP